MTILPKAIYRLPINLPMAFFTELKQQKKKMQICMETQKNSNSQNSLNKEEWGLRKHIP